MSGNAIPSNHLLAALPPAEWALIRRDARMISLPVGHTVRTPAAPVTTVYFPESGVISIVDVLDGGHHVEVAAIGKEGMIGVAALLDIRVIPFWQIVQVATTGYEIPASRFTDVFHQSEVLRRMIMAHLGRLIVQLARSASCNRFHSHRERLARWLTVLSTKSGQRTLELTHDFIAQMVGGPRHAVSAALNELRDAGVINYLRGRVEIIDEPGLVTFACNCYRANLMEFANG